MRKALVLFLIACMGLFPCHAAPGDGGELKLPVETGNIGGINGGIRPLMPKHPGLRVEKEWVHVYYDPASASLDIITPSGTGPVLIALQNITTGENYGYSFNDSDDVHTIPFMGGEGIWRISLVSLAPRKFSIICEGYFYMDNGFIREY